MAVCIRDSTSGFIVNVEVQICQGGGAVQKRVVQNSDFAVVSFGVEKRKKISDVLRNNKGKKKARLNTRFILHLRKTNCLWIPATFL